MAAAVAPVQRAMVSAQARTEVRLAYLWQLFQQGIGREFVVDVQVGGVAGDLTRSLMLPLRSPYPCHPPCLLCPSGLDQTHDPGSYASANPLLHATYLQGFHWRDTVLYETDEVNRLLRFLVDVPISGAAWLCLPPAPPLTRQQLRQPEAWEDPQASPSAGSGSSQAADAAQGQAAGGLGWRPVMESERISGCDVEAVAPWQAVCCLSPDATQLADPAWSPWGRSGSSQQQAPAELEVAQAAEAARRGDIAGLRVAAVDVLSATADGADRRDQPMHGWGWGQQAMGGAAGWMVL